MGDLVLLDKVKEMLLTSKKKLPDDVKKSLNVFLNENNNLLCLKSRNKKTRKQLKPNSSKTLTRKCISRLNHHTRKIKNKQNGRHTYTRKIKY